MCDNGKGWVGCVQMVHIKVCWSVMLDLKPKAVKVQTQRPAHINYDGTHLQYSLKMSICSFDIGEKRTKLHRVKPCPVAFPTAKDDRHTK